MSEHAPGTDPASEPDGFHDGTCFDCQQKKRSIAMWYAGAVIGLALCKSCRRTRLQGLLIPCISLCEPWATWIQWGWKTIETRTHNRFRCLTGLTIGIHASKRWDKDAFKLARPHLSADQLRRSTAIKYFARGYLRCTAMVDRIEPVLSFFDSRHALIDCAGTDRTGLFLSDVQVLRTSPATFAVGRLGIFHVAPAWENA